MYRSNLYFVQWILSKCTFANSAKTHSLKFPQFWCNIKYLVYDMYTVTRFFLLIHIVGVIYFALLMKYYTSYKHARKINMLMRYMDNMFYPNFTYVYFRHTFVGRQINYTNKNKTFVYFRVWYVKWTSKNINHGLR
jgi:hypothetical protein